MLAVTGEPAPPYGEDTLTPAGATGLEQAGGGDFAALPAASHRPAALWQGWRATWLRARRSCS
jgi:hypothetical protein